MKIARTKQQETATRRQIAFLAAVYLLSQRGFPPTLREVGGVIGARSMGWLSYMRDSLVRRGLLTHENFIARSMLVTPAGRELVESAEPDEAEMEPVEFEATS